MVALLLILIAAGVLWSLIDGRGEERAMKEYCELECRQYIKSRYSFCC